jgi:hypothetical protein
VTRRYINQTELLVRLRALMQPPPQRPSWWARLKEALQWEWEQE